MSQEVKTEVTAEPTKVHQNEFYCNYCGEELLYLYFELDGRKVLLSYGVYSLLYCHDCNKGYNREVWGFKETSIDHLDIEVME